VIEHQFDVPFIGNLALREKQIQQSYRPIIAVHKWFARRPGALFRGLLLSEFVAGPVRQSYYQSHQLESVKIADPFMGGGTPLLEANRIGCSTIGYDINPMAYWIVKQELEHLDLDAYRAAALAVRSALESEIGHLYRTRCVECGSHHAHAKYFLWLKTLPCSECGESVDLFPGYLVARDSRHPMNVFVCPECGGLTETPSREDPGMCSRCGCTLGGAPPARRNTCRCRGCGAAGKYPDPQGGPPQHRLFAIEYHCPNCKPKHTGRFFKQPDQEDLDLFAKAETAYRSMRSQSVPDDDIPPGDETTRLHRWGYKKYRDLFNERQLLALELTANLIKSQSDERLRNALATNLSDLLRYQNMLCRYDPTALKSLDIFSVHGFPVSLIQCESNFMGIRNGNNGCCIGSGGWLNITEKYAKAKAYCDSPYETRHEGKRKVRVPMKGEWIGDRADGRQGKGSRDVVLHCASATSADIEPDSLDGVFTDPPYFGNVQYAELMDFCYVWLRRLLGQEKPAFASPTTRHPDELTGNESMGRGLEHFTEGLSLVFRNMARALKPGAPLAFTYHHNKIEAYLPLAVAILDASLACSASLPCPAEMGASIHISGTGSSIVDTVFVCRSTGRVPREWVVTDIEGLAKLVQADIGQLRGAGLRPTQGDVRCVLFGHVVRTAIWELRATWNPHAPAKERITTVRDWIETNLAPSRALSLVHDGAIAEPALQVAAVREGSDTYGEEDSDVSF